MNNNTYSIYYLSDENGIPFYVGATKNSLKIRLGQHISYCSSKSGVGKLRFDKINNMISDGHIPNIRLLRKVPFEKVDHFESYYAFKFEKAGHKMIQLDRFNYQSVKSKKINNSKESRIVRGYKANDTSYNKAMKRAKREKLSLATLIEVWVISYGNKIPFLIDSEPSTAQP